MNGSPTDQAASKGGGGGQHTPQIRGKRPALTVPVLSGMLSVTGMRLFTWPRARPVLSDMLSVNPYVNCSRAER